MTIRHLLSIACIGITCLSLSNCAPVALGGVGAAGLSGIQERTLGNAVDDTAIWGEVKHHYLQKDFDNLFSGVNIDVAEGRVLLTGAVKDPKHRVDAVRLAWKPRGVKEVINEIQISQTGGLKNYAKDSWISARIRSKLLLNNDIKSINYSIDTINQKVYLMGIAQNTDERELAKSLASTISGVKRVVSHVRVKNHPHRN